MATQYLAGIAPQALVDDSAGAQAVCCQLMTHMQLWLRHLTAEEKKETVWKLASEMADDPLWAGSAAGDWDWDRYFAYASQPRVYATYANIGAFVCYQGLTVEIYQEEADGLELIWSEPGIGDGGAMRGGPVRLLRSGTHFDLLVPRPMRHRLWGKGPASKRARCN